VSERVRRESDLCDPRLSPDSRIPDLARACAAAGGRLLVVGGWVRDRLLGRSLAGGVEDLDLEVQGLAPERLHVLLVGFGDVHRVGRAFPVHLVKGLVPGRPVDVSLPRTGDPGEDGSPPGFDPALDFAQASRGRDLRVNAMAWDPLTGEILDPHDGRRDLVSGVLRATDAARFGRDPVRGLRTAQLAARLEMEPDAELRRLSAATDLARAAPERVQGEFRRLLLRAARPSLGLVLLREMALLRFFPELLALVGCPQEPEWHPEGDVWVHTLLVVDEAARQRGGEVGNADAEQRDLLLMLGALCHDLGKPTTTETRDGRVVSRRHSPAGVGPTASLLARMRAGHALVRGTQALVRHHLAPAQFVRSAGGAPEAGPRAYRRLLRQLREDGVDLDLLYRVARADHLGRTTEDALAGRFPAGDIFLARAREIDAIPLTYEPVVKGRHLLARGIPPGPGMGRLLARCRRIQDETGWSEPDEILARALVPPLP
jgi:tRNA nucleotidyltransferase (CCA-adding enzyme)